ncbi:hypothetical protein D3H65_29725 [Paraflavitalea soli]|uniref:Uncharacterized protein n=1 Tax=Paraflavitalea soli TaxID=2315862 RepID=A0A3B7MVG2_9BACT|nr:hypothetical protein [Paraflavitalea soli]AXY77917.1 hypothetical protein D3H65_29725 [Paraflavitalea soli]
MITSSDPDYLDTKLVKQGAKRMDPVLQQLADWITEQFNTPVLNIYYDKIEPDKQRPRLRIIFEFGEEVARFKDPTGNFDAGKQSLIAAQFKQIQAAEPAMHRGFFNWLLKTRPPVRFDTAHVVVVFTAFEPVAREAVNRAISNEALKHLKEALAMESLWIILREFSTSTVFFYTDQQLEQSATDGTRDLITQKYRSLLKSHDEFDYITPTTCILLWDSKENLDKNYKGNWFWYSRR